MATTILLARHGETDWNREGRLQGHADPPLNDRGREQARELALRLAGVGLDAIYASDLRRALETAEVVAAAHALPVTRDAGLREIDVGSWSGLTREKIEERFPESHHHDGETRDQHLSRVLRAVERIALRHGGADRILIVSHGGSLRALRRHTLPAETIPRLENCAVYALAFENGNWMRVDG